MTETMEMATRAVLLETGAAQVEKMAGEDTEAPQKDQ